MIDKKKLTQYAIYGAIAVGIVAVWKYVQGQSVNNSAVNQADAQGAATADILAAQEQQAQISQQLGALYPQTAQTLTGGSMGVGTAVVAATPANTNSVGVVPNSTAQTTNYQGGVQGNTGPPLTTPQSVLNFVTGKTG